MKKISLATVIVFLTFGLTPAQATQAPTIAIIDSGFDVSRISGNVVQEVCAITTSRCNNRSSVEVGPGASGTVNTIAPRFVSDWEHGTRMANFILEENPNARLVLIRNSKLYGGTVLPGTEQDTLVALNWVISNAQKYNIVAVSMSRGSHRHVLADREFAQLSGSIKVHTTLVENIRSRPVVNARVLQVFEARLNDLRLRLSLLKKIECPATTQLVTAISSLQANNVATIVATGNDGNKFYVDYPACIDEAVSVAAASSPGTLASVSNISENTDFVTKGFTTSEATARLAGLWSRVYNGTYESTYSLISSSGQRVVGWSAVFTN